FIEMSYSFTMRWSRSHRWIVRSHCWSSQQWHPAGRPFARNVVNEPLLIFRVCCRSPGDNLFRCICGKDLFPGNGNTLATILRVDLWHVGLEPRPVAIESFAPHVRFGILFGIGHFFHDHCRSLLRWHWSISSRAIPGRSDSSLGVHEYAIILAKGVSRLSQQP